MKVYDVFPSTCQQTLLAVPAVFLLMVELVDVTKKKFMAEDAANLDGYQHE